MRAQVEAAGAHATPVIDRFWFKSVYFKEPGGVLFELATDGPGFATDEDPAHLGETLVLPPWLEPSRERIEAVLPSLTTPESPGRDLTGGGAGGSRSLHYMKHKRRWPAAVPLWTATRPRRCVTFATVHHGVLATKQPCLRTRTVLGPSSFRASMFGREPGGLTQAWGE